MHLLPRGLVRSKQSGGEMDSKHKGRKPKLERRNALKNVDYEASPSSYDDSAALRTRSLDMALLGDRTSFRVEGIDGVDRICRSLGLSGPEEFEIPAAAWEAVNFRSLSDQFPMSRFPRPERDRSQEPWKEAPPEVQDELVLEDSVRVSDVFETQKHGVELNTCSITVESSIGCGGGIKGVRPPLLLAPPPPMLIRATDEGCSTWDILRSFGPEIDGLSSFTIADGRSDEEEVDGTTDPDVRLEVGGLRLGETAILSGSCSFTTSNDDDSSSTTSNISPIGRFRPSITCWEKGELLGRGSFGSVYEGIAE